MRRNCFQIHPGVSWAGKVRNAKLDLHRPVLGSRPSTSSRRLRRVADIANAGRSRRGSVPAKAAPLQIALTDRSQQELTGALRLGNSMEEPMSNQDFENRNPSEKQGAPGRQAAQHVGDE